MIIVAPALCAVHAALYTYEFWTKSSTLEPLVLDRVHYKWYQLGTYSLLHANLMHLLHNTMMLAVGFLHEYSCGSFAFVLVYISGVLAAALVWLLMACSDRQVVGCSGGVMAVIAAIAFTCDEAHAWHWRAITVSQFFEDVIRVWFADSKSQRVSAKMTMVGHCAGALAGCVAVHVGTRCLVVMPEFWYQYRIF